MAVAYWPTSLPQIPQAESWQGGPLEDRIMFPADVPGELISRPRTTGETWGYQATFRQLTLAQRNAFISFATTTLSRATAKFVWRNPETGELRWWQINKGDRKYQITALDNGRFNLQLSLLQLAPVPWFAEYVRSGNSVAPEFVADWDQDVYGIDGAKVPASSLPTIEGTYDTYTTDSGDVETFQDDDVITAGDITEAQPGSGTKSIIGFPSTPL